MPVPDDMNTHLTADEQWEKDNAPPEDRRALCISLCTLAFSIPALIGA
jgi:hypothetical protein